MGSQTSKFNKLETTRVDWDKGRKLTETAFTTFQHSWSYLTLELKLKNKVTEGGTSTSYILLQHPIAPPKVAVKARYQLCDSSAKGFHKSRQAPAAMPKALFSSTLCGHAMKVTLLRQEQIRFFLMIIFLTVFAETATSLTRKSAIILRSSVDIPKSLVKQIHTNTYFQIGPPTHQCLPHQGITSLLRQIFLWRLRPSKPTAANSSPISSIPSPNSTKLVHGRQNSKDVRYLRSQSIHYLTQFHSFTGFDGYLLKLMGLWYLTCPDVEDQSTRRPRLPNFF